MRLFFLSLILLTIGACKKEVDLSQPYYESKIVVDGSIETGHYAKVYLTLSSPYLTHYDSASIRESFLNHAKITLTSTTGEEEILTLFRENRFFPPFVYKSISIRGVAGKGYHLKVELAGREITSYTTIPNPPQVSGVRFSQQTDTTGFAEFAIVPPLNGEQYLFTRVKSAFIDENFHPTRRPLARISYDDPTPKWEQALRVSETRIHFFDKKQLVYNDYPSLVYDLRDTIKILPGTLDSVSYEVLKSLFSDLNSQENPFEFNGNSIKTNINGGIGRWTGIGINTPLQLTGNR